MNCDDYLYGLLCYLKSCISVNEAKAARALLEDNLDANIYFSGKVFAYQNIYDSIQESFLIFENSPL